MLAKNHSQLGFIAAMLTAKAIALGPIATAFLAGSATYGAIAPDIDEPNSKIGRLVTKIGIILCLIAYAGYLLKPEKIPLNTLFYTGIIALLPMLIKTIFGHRGVTHYLLPALALLGYAVFLNFYCIQNGTFLSSIGAVVFLGFSIGWFLHSIGDLVAQNGIDDYFFPIKGRVVLLPSFLRFTVGGMAEKYVVTPTLFSVSLYSIYLYIQVV